DQGGEDHEGAADRDQRVGAHTRGLVPQVAIDAERRAGDERRGQAQGDGEVIHGCTLPPRPGCAKPDQCPASAGGGGAPARLRRSSRTSGSIRRKLHAVTLKTSMIAVISACIPIWPAMIAMACGSVGVR